MEDHSVQGELVGLQLDPESAETKAGPYAGPATNRVPSAEAATEDQSLGGAAVGRQEAPELVEM